MYSNAHVKNWNGILTTTNSKIKIISNPNDNVVRGSIWTKGGWAEEEIIRLKKVISNLKNNKEPKNLLVVGAHIGSVVLEISNKFKVVDAVEANPENFSLLKLNIAINAILNICPFNFLVSDNSNYKEFLLHPSNTGGSKIMPIFKNPEYFKEIPQFSKNERSNFR